MKKTTLSSQKQSGTKARAILQCPDASHFVSTDVVFISPTEHLYIPNTKAGPKEVQFRQVLLYLTFLLILLPNTDLLVDYVRGCT
jgi:hypothetical protein